MHYDVAIITATPFEQDLLRRKMVDAVVFTEARKCCVSGVLGKLDVLLIETGIGAVNCSHALTHLLQTYDVSQVWQIGVGGAYPQSDLSVGDIAIASVEHYGDVGVRTDEGWVGLEDSIEIPILSAEQNLLNRKIFNRLELDLAAAKLAAKIVGEKWHTVVGPFVTVQECSGTDALGQERGAFFSACCENMEGAAAAHICSIYDKKLFELRSMSNIVKARNKSEWDLPLACRCAQEAVIVLSSEGFKIS
ncbi:MAG: futalosine hydrolase [Candidatus Latescibacterota bacterium]|nr:futalosine hydrolase [Candidatus Latescibacterota bacterium]